MKNITGNPQIDDLLHRASLRTLGAERVHGHVGACHTEISDSSALYMVYIQNGPLRHAFWIAHDGNDSGFHPPLPGDFVSGVINTLDETVPFADLSLVPIFDFRNQTREREQTVFDQLRAYHARLNPR